MRITFLIESATQIWGGVKSALEAANALQARDHRVAVVCKSAAPAWMPLDCAFFETTDFSSANIPDSDVVIGTFWTTVPHAIACNKGVPVHYCQGFEAAGVSDPQLAAKIHAVYSLHEARKITISKHLQEIIASFDQPSRLVTYAIDHAAMHPGAIRPVKHPIRVGLIGPYEIPWKDLQTGYEACRLAHAAGLEFELVRATNTTPHAAEGSMPFPIEWHRQIPPAEMGDIYRSMDVFLGTSRGIEEGFFLPAIEAMACGIPCVLTDIPCFRGYGSGDYALFVPPQDPVAMAKALVMASKNLPARSKLSTAGILIASRYHMDRHIDDFERALEDIVLEDSRQSVSLGVLHQRRARAKPSNLCSRNA